MHTMNTAGVSKHLIDDEIKSLSTVKKEYRTSMSLELVN